MNKVELFFVKPTIFNIEKSIIMGHFTSSKNLKNKTVFDLGIKVHDHKISDIFRFSDFVDPKLEEQDKEDDLSFLNSPSLNDLMRNNKLNVYDSNNKELIISQVMILQTPSLKENEYSYLFFGFTPKEFAQYFHSKVFFKDENEQIMSGGNVIHEMGNNIAMMFTHNFSFGFGEKLRLSCTSSKEYLEGLQKYKNILNSNEEKNEKTKKELKTVFGFYDDQFFVYMDEMNKLCINSGIDPEMPFWMNKTESDQREELSKKAISNIMQKEY